MSEADPSDYRRGGGRPFPSFAAVPLVAETVTIGAHSTWP